MTEQQIKQNAEAYINKMPPLCDALYESVAKEAFITGAHSRDEEIGTLEGLLKISEHEIKQLRSPWISVEERLPEKAIGKSERSEYVLCRHKNGSYYVAYWHVGLEYWYSMPYEIDKSNITHWMPIPEV